MAVLSADHRCGACRTSKDGARCGHRWSIVSRFADGVHLFRRESTENHSQTRRRRMMRTVGNAATRGPRCDEAVADRVLRRHDGVGRAVGHQQHATSCPEARVRRCRSLDASARPRSPRGQPGAGQDGQHDQRPEVAVTKAAGIQEFGPTLAIESDATASSVAREPSQRS